MEARCTGCGGRVMPYRQYVLHFSPTATCACCGERVRFRCFATVLSVILVGALAFFLFTRLVDSLPLELTAGALLLLGALLGDLWTYRNLTWDPVRERHAEGPSTDGFSRGGRHRG